MKKVLFFFLLLIIAHTNVSAQGCSDAGFCSMGNLKHGQPTLDSTQKQQLSIQLTNGIGDEHVYVFTPTIQYDNRWNKNFSFQAKLTGNFASGKLGDIAGLGDIFLSVGYTPFPKEKWKKTFLLGTKLPLNNSNLKKDGLSYPMQYQSSLGTTDVVAGFSIDNDTWVFATGIQQPINTHNENSFLPNYWTNRNAFKFAPSNCFQRKGDVLGRIGYTLKSTHKFNIKTGLLGIYHVGRDSYSDALINGKNMEIIGSDGFTLNGTIALWYKINSKLSFGFNGGFPFIVRDIRPDGLTRSFSVSPDLIFKF